MHPDIKKRGRFEWPGQRLTGNRRQQTRGADREAVHAAIDDHSRIAFSSAHADETGSRACQALLPAMHDDDRPGSCCKSVFTDNGAAGVDVRRML